MVVQCRCYPNGYAWEVDRRALLVEVFLFLCLHASQVLLLQGAKKTYLGSAAVPIPVRVSVPESPLRPTGVVLQEGAEAPGEEAPSGVEVILLLD